MIAPAPQIDYTRIEFPSDRLTLKDVRTTCLTRPGEKGISAVEKEFTKAGCMQEIEKDFAQLGFASVLGNADQVLEEITGGLEGGIENLIEDLTNYYVRFHLADGSGTGRELIRRLQEAGAVQARERLGQTR